jgi:hypothetical protein
VQGDQTRRPVTNNLEKQDFAKGTPTAPSSPAGKIARTDGLESPHTRTEELWHPYGRKIDRMLKGKSAGNSWVFFDHIWRNKAATLFLQMNSASFKVAAPQPALWRQSEEAG